MLRTESPNGVERNPEALIEARIKAAIVGTMRIAQRTIKSGQVLQLTLAWREPDGSFVLNTQDAGLGREVSPVRLDRQTLVDGFMNELKRQGAEDVGVSRRRVVDQYNVTCRFSEYRFDLGADKGLSLVHVFNTRFGDGVIRDEYIMRKNQGS